MRRLIASMAIVAIVALCIIAIDRSARAETKQLVVNGQARTYLIERPTARGASATIIMLHGAFGTADGAAQQTGLAQLGPREGFAAVFPQAHTVVWNRFPRGKESRQAIEFFSQRGGLPDDVGFLRMLVAELVRGGVSDPARIYLAGSSNGGFMTLTMICNEAALFAGAGVVIASMIEQAGEDCRPARPMPIIMLNGTADVTVPYGGGLVAPLKGQQGSNLAVWSAERTAAFFRQLNGCDRPPERAVLPGGHPLRIEIERSTSCKGGSVIAHRAVGGTHDSTPQALGVGRLLLEFFRDSRRPR